MELFPRPKPDRRYLPNIPSKNTTRRSGDMRFFAELDLEVFQEGGKKQRIATGRILDISDSGLAANLPPGNFSPNDRFRLKFMLNPGTMPESYESLIKISATVARTDPAQELVAFQFTSSLSTHLRKRRWIYMEGMALFLLFVAFLGVAYIKLDSVFYFWFDVPIFLYGLCAVVYLLTRFLFAAFYRGWRVDPEFTPSVSIVIPCFNEEEWIGETVRCCLNQDYPEDKLEVIAVDDGSTDKSLEVLRESQLQLVPLVGDRFKVLAQPKNMGKRHALARGTLEAKGEFVIFVDSDSFLMPDSVLNLVQPLKNPKIAACTGRCDVENKWTNFLTKMQAVRYFIGFRVFKAAESVFDAVTCLSGPLACYRKSLVIKYLEPWTQQKFLGRPATFGDDRSLTNFMLRKHRTVYQNNAVCSTIVPSGYGMFFRQQMRWKRSWLRESLRAASFMWAKEPFMAISFYLGFVLPILALAVVFRAFVYLPLMYGIFPYMYLVGIFLMGMLMCTTYLMIRRSSLWFYGTFFNFFYLFVLLWQMVPAIFTFWKPDWGTRPSKIGQTEEVKPESYQASISNQPIVGCTDNG